MTAPSLFPHVHLLASFHLSNVGQQRLGVGAIIIAGLRHDRGGGGFEGVCYIRKRLMRAQEERAPCERLDALGPRGCPALILKYPPLSLPLHLDLRRRHRQNGEQQRQAAHCVYDVKQG